MKAKEIQMCAKCRNGVAAAGPVFYTATIQAHCLDARGIQRTHGLEQFFGGGNTGATLARIMGDDPDISQPLGEASRVWVCGSCALEPALLAQFLPESSGEETDAT